MKRLAEAITELVLFVLCLVLLPLMFD